MSAKRHGSKGNDHTNKRRRSKQQEPADWGDVSADTIKGFVLLAQRLDGAVRFGTSRDGGVFSIGFYVGDERFTEWVRNDADRDSELARLWDEIADDFSVTDTIL